MQCLPLNCTSPRLISEDLCLGCEPLAKIALVLRMQRAEEAVGQDTVSRNEISAFATQLSISEPTANRERSQIALFFGQLVRWRSSVCDASNAPLAVFESLGECSRAATDARVL